MTRQRRNFDPGFELEVVRMFTEQGLIILHVSRMMDICMTAIRRWMEHYEAEQQGRLIIDKPLTAEHQHIYVTNYIAGFYNCERLHSVLGNLSPSVYERKMAEKEPIVVSEIT